MSAISDIEGSLLGSVALTTNLGLDNPYPVEFLALRLQ